MTFGRRSFSERHVTFSAREIRVLLLRVNFEIQNAALVGRRRNVTAIRAAAGLHRHLHRLEVDCTERRGINLVTIQTIQIRVLATLVPEPAGGNATTPTRKHRRIRAHARGQRRIEINLSRSGRLQLMTNFAALRFGGNTRISAVTSETDRVTVRNCLERALLQPKIVADVFRRFRHVLFA